MSVAAAEYLSPTPADVAWLIATVGGRQSKLVPAVQPPRT